MAKNKTTDMARKLAPFITGIASDVSEETAIKEIEAVLQALETHKNSADHDEDPHNWTALNKFFQVLGVVGLLPLTQTADIGSVTNLFAKGYFAELSTLIFKKENVLVMDGTFVITKQSGKFPADVSATDTQIDFGQTLTVGDFLLLRAEGKQEFMRVGSKVSGTTYNVTRNLDGTGADSWPAQSVYFVRGHQGDGWLELTATDDQRFSVFVQGENWNQFTEIGRFGKLDSWQGAGLTGYGIAIGNYANSEYMYYDTVTGKYFVSGEVQAANGLSILKQNGLNFYSYGQGLFYWYGNQMRGEIQESFEPQFGQSWLNISYKGEYGIQLYGGRQGYAKRAYINEYGLSTNGALSAYGDLSAGNIKTTPTANAIPKADATGKLDAGWIPALSYAPRQEMVGLKRTTAQSIPRAAWTSIIWNSEDYDTFNFWTSGSAVHAYNAGIYNISAYVGTSGMASGLFTVGIFINSESVPRLQQNASVYSGGIHILLSGALKLESGDIVYVKIYHDNATALSTLTSQPSRLHLCWISN